jgi:hypothetical protein
VAWKQIYRRNGIKQKDRKEIEIIKKLRHHHIIELVGTYTYGPYLGLLLWPVAVCDLATFLEDANTITNFDHLEPDYASDAEFAEYEMH